MQQTIIKKITIIINVVYALVLLLFLLDNLNSFDIKNQTIKSFVYFGFIIESPLILIWNLFLLKTKSIRIIGTVLPAIILILVILSGPNKILFRIGAWKTQTILYENGHLRFKTIEFQMQDLGALGYNKRTVEVFYLTKLFIIIKDLPEDIDSKVEWIKVDKDINALKLK